MVTRHDAANPWRNGLSWLAWLFVLASGLPTAWTPVLVAGTVAQEYRRDVWRREDGLPDNRVRVILQTGDGYLWIGTESGLARFDGLQFTTFRRMNSPAFVSDDCTALAEDHEGSLWIGTTRGLLRLKEGAFQRFTMSDGLSSEHVLDVASHDESVWIATTNGITRFRNGSFVAFGTEQNAEAGLYRARMFCRDRNGMLWMSTVAGLRRFDGKSGQFETVFQGGVWPDALISESGRGLWFRRGGNVTEHCDGKWLDRAETPPGFDTCMLADRQGSVWIGSVHKGMARYRQGQFEFYTRSNGLSDDWVLCFCEDREGNLWIGTGRGGLNRWTPQKFRSITVDQGLPHENTWTVCDSPDGGVWIGTDGGLCKWQNERIASVITAADGLFDPKIRALAVGKDNVVWIGNSLGLNKLQEGKVAGFRFPSDLPFNKTRALLEDRSGTLWVGWEHGLARLMNDEWTYFNRTNGGLSHSDVRALLEDRKGNLWIGTYGGGLNCWRTNGSHEIYSSRQGLTNDFISVIHQDAEGVLWVGTERGLNRFKGRRFSSINASQGLFDDVINWLLEDGRGNFWISTDAGIYRVARKDLNDVADGKAARVVSTVFNEVDGLPHRETNGRKSHPAGCKTRSGHLIFPTTKGVVIIDPARFEETRLTPGVAIEQILANREVIFSSAPDSHSPAKFAGSKTGISLPPGQSAVLEFHYTANWLADPNGVEFKYRLLGSHSHWVDAQNRRVAYYTDLRPGHYTFQVVARNHHGQWNETGANLAFFLAPYFYQTWWFYVLAAGLFGLLAGAVYRWRIRELRDMAVAHELERISHDLHDSLSGMLTRHSLLVDQARRSADASPTMQQHFQTLADSTREVLQRLKETIWATDPRCDSLDNLVPYLTHYATQFMGPSGIRCRFDVPREVPSVSLPPGLRNHILLTVKEALNNAVRHSGATELCLRLGIENGRLLIAVDDNGRGFDKDAASDKGNGLANMRRRVEVCGGNLSIISAPGQGTKIDVDIPLDSKAKLRTPKRLT